MGGGGSRDVEDEPDSSFRGSYRGVFVASASEYGARKVESGLYQSDIEVTHDLVDWCSGAKAKGDFEQVQKTSGVLSIAFVRGAGRPLVRIQGAEKNSVNRAADIIQQTINVQKELAEYAQAMAKVKREQDAVMEDVKKGLRDSFEVPQEILGLIIGKEGKNISALDAVSRAGVLWLLASPPHDKSCACMRTLPH